MKIIRFLSMVTLLAGLLFISSNFVFALPPKEVAGTSDGGSKGNENTAISIRTNSSLVPVNTCSEIDVKCDSQTIREQYMMDLSEFQSVGFKIQDLDGKERTIDVNPAVHYIDKDKREKIVVYNSELPNIISIFRAKLQAEYEKYNAERENAINTSGFFKQFFVKLRHPTMKNVIDSADHKVIFGSPETWIQSPHNSSCHRLEELSDTCVHLRHILSTCGNELSNTSTPCAFIIDVQAVANCDNTRIWIERMETPKEYYQMVEEGFYRIANSPLSNRDMVVAMDKCLDEFLHKLNPRASDQQTIDFCFALSRVDYYLSRLEKAQLFRSSEEIEVMDKLRRKIEALYIEHRFIFVRNAAPILDVPINYGQIIAKTGNRTIMFIDRNEVQQRFIKRLEDALDRNASAISKEYNFKARSGPELRKIANELRPEGYQEMIDKMQEQILAFEEEESQCKATAEAEKTKVALKLCKDGVKLAITAISGGASEALQAIASQIASREFSEEDVRNYVAEEERLKLEEKTVDPMYELLHPNFDNPRNIVVENLSGAETPHYPVDYGFSMESTTLRRPNLTAIGKIVEQQGLEPQDIDALVSSMNQYLKSLHIRGKIDLRRSQMNFIEHIRDNESEFINLFSLYIEMLRHNFLERTDFSGVIIDEHKTANGEREKRLWKYFVYDIPKLEET